MRRTGQNIAAALVVACGAAAAVAGTVTLTAVRDNTVFQESLNSAGADDNVFAGMTSQGDIRRALVRFDLSGVPAGSMVTAAELRLYCTRTNSSSGARSVSLHRLLADWGEGTSGGGGQGGEGAPPTAGCSTWVHRFYTGQLWAAPGGDFAPGASATALVNAEGSYEWEAAGMVPDVQAWVDSPAGNFGWMVRGDEAASGVAKRFASREASQAARRPTLTVTFTPPATTGACCLAGGVCALLTAGECTGQGGAFQGVGTACAPSPCPSPVGACCHPEGTCFAASSTECSPAGGVWQGAGTLCSPNPCPALTGACCYANATCQTLTGVQCAAQGGTFAGAGTTCATVECPWVLVPFVDSLPRPGVAQPDTGLPGGAAAYTMRITEQSQRLHRDLPLTRVWGFNGGYPGPTIEAWRGAPVEVTWVNDLRDEQGALRQHHVLPVDPCVHGAGTDAPRTVVHLHGGHVPMSSDGYPEWTFLPGQQSPPYTYPNTQPPGTVWYHDHAIGITRLNVYMGMAGFYLIRDAAEQALGLPSGAYEVPLAIQDRSFNADGSLKYPAMWMEHFFGDFVVVNGKVWPYMEVRRGKYRLRMLNGSTSRTYTLGLSNGAPFHQIGTDLGLLGAPVQVQGVTIQPGERADVVIDFGGYTVGTEIILTNSAPAPYPGAPGVGVVPDVMKFIVQEETGGPSTLPATLTPVPRLEEADAAVHREFMLHKMSDPCTGSVWMINGLMWGDITERPRLDTTEVWSFVNASGVSHPMHMHLVQFQVLDRQDFQMVGGVPTPSGPRVPPPPEEAGWKDTVRCDPQEITRVIARFEGYLGKYAYHCHILEHEEHAMMRQFETTCYANCDASVTPPALNVADFGCFLTEYAAGNPYANCDGSTAPPALNVADFGCFLTKYAAGCP
ncbi:MAG: multicopper oxidase domain-containing protein [Phycisphaerales bacterium]